VFKLSNWSYSRYSTWKKCPAKLKFQHEFPKPRETEGAAYRGTLIHSLIEKFLMGDTDELGDELEYYRPYFLKLREAKVIPELPIAITKDWKVTQWDDEGRWWRGVLDAVVQDENETIVIDWKTGQEYKDHRDQREIYATTYGAIDDSRPWIKVIHTYLDKKKNTFTLFHQDDLPALRKDWEGRIDEMFNDEALIPNPGFHCRYCPYSRDAGGPCKF
jgi:hypothetical protein